MSGPTATGTSPGGSATTTVAQRPSGHHRRHKSDINLGSLLRLFKSGFFDSWLTISYLYRYPSPGVHDYLVNELYKLPDADIEFYVFQLCSLLTFRTFQTQSLERFIMEKCSKSAHFATQIAWILEAAIEDNDPNTIERCKQLREDVELACVNSCRPPLRAARKPRVTFSPSVSPPPASQSSSSSSSSSSSASTSSGPLARLSRSASNVGSSTAISRSVQPPDSPMSCPDMQSAGDDPSTASQDDELHEALAKKDRLEFFNMILGFVQGLGKLSENLKATPVELRQAKLQRELQKINQNLSVGLYLPIMRADEKHHCIVRLVPDTAKVLNSRERVPYLFDVEVLESDVSCSTIDLHKQALSFLPVITNVRDSSVARFSAPPLSHGDGDRAPDLPLSPLASHVPRSHSNPDLNVELSRSPSSSSPPGDSLAHADNSSSSAIVALPDTDTLDADDFHDIVDERLASTAAAAAAAAATSASGMAARSRSSALLADKPSEETERASKFPLREFWEEKKARIRRSSPFGHLPNWNLFSVIYKHGDDLRQEQLAIQLIKQLHTIFQDAGLPLYLKPYHILVTSGHSGLIEVLRDAVSIHQLKKEVDGFVSLSQWFKESFGYPSRAYLLAQRNFVESLAGYSIVTHLLAIKDRHNGNILIDAYGRIIHIDYGFMLTNSPGFNMNFESAPFKLTQEYIDVMEGVDSSIYQYFKALLIRGFIEARKHADKVVSLVEMMLEGSTLPCFARGEAAAIELRERFCQSLTEDEYVAHIEGLIEKSANNWNTRQYDKFQLITNSILY